MTERISYVSEGGVGFIRMDDGKANAMNFDFFEALNKALDAAKADGASVLVFEGRGKFFSGGLDLKLIPTLTPQRLKGLGRQLAQTLLRVWTLEIPTVAALQGHAIAGGALLTMACDSRIALDGPGRFHVNEAAIGIALPTWSIELCRSAIPVRWHTPLLLQAKPVTWSQAAAWGVVDELVAPDGDLRAAARRAAIGLQLLDRNAYATIKTRMRGPIAQAGLAIVDDEFDAQLP